MSEITTNEEYAEQEEARRQELIAEDVAMHEETDEESPFPGDAEAQDVVDAEDKPKAKKAKKAKKA